LLPMPDKMHGINDPRFASASAMPIDRR
jgi:hypothetical protein